jgi:hypothetical protein
MKHLTEDDLKQYFGLRMLQPPRRAVRTQKVRSIIY